VVVLISKSCCFLATADVYLSPYPLGSNKGLLRPESPSNLWRSPGRTAEPLELSCGMLGACTAYPSDVKDYHSSIHRGTPLEDRPLQTPHDCRFTLLPGIEIRRCYMRRHLERILICMNYEPINVNRAQGETHVRGLPLDKMLRRARRRIMTDSEDRFIEGPVRQEAKSPHTPQVICR
jgi:hypothetical protein